MFKNLVIATFFKKKTCYEKSYIWFNQYFEFIRYDSVWNDITKWSEGSQAVRNSLLYQLHTKEFVSELFIRTKLFKVMKLRVIIEIDNISRNECFISCLIRTFKGRQVKNLFVTLSMVCLMDDETILDYEICFVLSWSW